MRTKLLYLSALLAASMLTGGADVAQAQNFYKNNAKAVKSSTAPGLMTAMAPIFDYPDKPCTAKFYDREAECDSFTLFSEESFEYDENGFVSKFNLLELPDSIFTTMYLTSDENGRVTESRTYYSETGYDKMFDALIEYYRYDSIVDDILIYYKRYNNDAEDLTSDPVWNIRNADSLVIVRDSQDRIVSSDRYSWYNGFIPVQKEKCTYGEGIGPEKIEYVKYMGDGTYYNVVNDSIVWKKCANQIYGADMLSEIVNYDGYQLVSMIEKSELEDETIKFVYKYDDADRVTEKWAYVIVGDSIESAIVNKKEYLDDNDSYKYYQYYAKDVNGDGVFDDSEMNFSNGHCVVFDDKGREIMNEGYMKDPTDGVVKTFSQKFIKYVEDEKGRVLEISSEFLYNGEIIFENKGVFTYNDNATGIASVNRNGMDLKVNGNVVSFGGAEGRYMVCNADGRLVMSGSAADGWVSLENLPAGLYIVKVNGEAVKVVR